MSATVIKVYNTQRITDEESLQNFIARKKEFGILVNVLNNTKANGIPQHQLIIGQRGMGKTTLLKRLEVELRRDPLNKRFLPLLFPEEQYNLDNLSSFWLNCLDAMADILDIQGAKEDVKELDDEIDRLVSMADIPQRTEKAYRFFCHTTFNQGRIPVLLIDNIDFVFRRLNQDELHVLRAFLTENGAPLVIGASSSPVLETENYDSPFYDAFQIHYLKKLSTHELLEVMRALARNEKSEGVRMEITRHRARLKAINQLTGGNPRTAVILFNQIQKGFSDTIIEDLELILDELTPIYKARYEELSEKQQIIVNAIAMNWDPLSLDKIRALTGLDGGQLSPQLKRLVETGWIEKPLNERYKGGAYELCERMFNIWYLMRRSSRRQKKGVFCLSKYLEAFYENEEELSVWINKLIAGPLTSHHHAITALALAKLSSDKEARWKLHAKSRAYIKTNPNFIQQVDTSDLYDSLEETLQAFKEAIQQKDAQQIIISTEPLLSRQEAVPFLDVVIKNRVIAFIELERYEEGVELMRQHPEIEEVSSLWVNLAAGIHNRKGSAETVEECLKKAIASDDKNGEAYMYLGKLYTEVLQFEAAEKALDQASLFIPKDSMDLVLAKGVLYVQNDRGEEGEKLLKTILSKNGDNREALFYLGRYYFLNRQVDYGMSQFSRLYDNDRENVFIRAWVHVVSDQLDGRGPSVLPEKDTTLSRAELAVLYRKVAAVYEMEDMRDWAYPYWSMAVSMDENDVDSLISMVEYCIDEDMSDEAIANVDRLLEKVPNNTHALLLGGFVYFGQENWDKARELISKATEVDQSGELYYFLGVLYERLSNYNEAKKCYLKALDSDMENKDAVLHSLGELERNWFGDFVAAESCFVQLKEKNPYLLISLYRDDMDRVAEARALFDALPYPEEDSTEYELEQVLFSIRAGLLDNAHELLSQCFERLKKEPDFSILPESFYRFYAVCLLHYDVGEWLLQELEKADLREEIAPDYHAIKAVMSQNPDAYLDTVALEIREVSKKIVSQIKNK